jgi:hypothetical protein
MRRISQTKQQSGMILILVVLVIGTVLTTAAIFANLIIREIQQSRLLDQSIQSYYLAESGAERALLQIRYRQAISQCPGSQTCLENGYCSGNNDLPCINRDNTGLNILSGWQIKVENEKSTVVTLQPGESFQVDLFDPLQSESSNIDGISIVNKSESQSLNLYGTFINITNILKNVLASNCEMQPPVFKGRINLNQYLNMNALSGQTILRDCAYTFRLQNNDQADARVEISVYQRQNQQGQIVLAPLDIPSRLIIDSTAIFGDSFQRLKVKTPMRPPLSGLYDFVLFSEEKVVK